jgi:hypothetical protein
MHHRFTTQVALTFGALFGQNVAQMRLLTLEATRPGSLEPLGGPAIGLHFRHDKLPFDLLIIRLAESECTDATIRFTTAQA